MSTAWLESAAAHWNAGRAEQAMADAWKAYDAAPGGFAERALVVRILRERPQFAGAGRGDALQSLATDPDIDPGGVSDAGWCFLRNETGLFGVPDDSPSLARRLESNDLALTLLREDLVASQQAEAALTPVRRWLLEEGRWRAYPLLAAALVAQAALNGGAWPFDEAERALLDAGGEFAPAYLPARETGAPHALYGDAVTRAVAEQYEGWPYPQWTRISKPKPMTLAEQVRKLDPQGPDTIPHGGAKILIAGCGTGRQVAHAAGRYVQDALTAIDISQASLRYAERACAAAGVRGVEYLALDLHAAETLGRKFDAVFCTGVLHHLPDPEAGWAALARVLNPGGAMHVMVYSKLARMRIVALRRSLSDLASQPMSDDVLREARRRVSAMPDAPRLASRDFYSLAGVHDLLMHRHEDPFDIPRIRRALEVLDLRLIQFEIPRTETRAAYVKKHPDDPLQRDFAGWTALEFDNPTLYAGMYGLWCRKR